MTRAPLPFRPDLITSVITIGLVLYPLFALAESGPPPPGVATGMKVPIITQLLYLCGAVATVMVAIIGFVVLGRCRYHAIHLGSDPSPAAVKELKRRITTTLVGGLLISGGYLYLTYYALAILVPTIKLPRFAYMLSIVTIGTAAAGLFMVFVALRCRRALPPRE